MSNKYEQLSHLRKQLQSDGLAPQWMSTASYQLLTGQEYLDTAETPKAMYERITRRAAELTEFKIPSYLGYDSWNDAFFDILWKGWLSPSTPVLTNMGNTRGHPIACSGTYLGDSIRSFGLAELEIMQLTQRGYGTSWCLDPVRHRGSAISKGGTADGVMHPAASVVARMKRVSQGTRRADYIWKKMVRTKMIKGKGYFFFLDKVNRHRPQMYIDRGFFVRHSNLCAEIALMCDKDHSFTCVLSSMNISKYDEWKDTYAIQIATIFLDAVISDMLIKAKKEEGFERIVAFTEKSRAIGLGQLGISTYYQQQNWVYGDFQSIQFNQMLTTLLDRETLTASRLLAKEVGEPEWMEGYGERFSHRLAFPPTKSTAIVMGGISEGINPVYANVYAQDTAGGMVFRINPVLLPIMKERGQYTEAVMARISEAQGSVQGEDWLSDHEKKVFRTAFELNQEAILLMGSHRQRIMSEGGGGQGQSLNLFITKEESEEEISRLHNIALEDDYIHSLYYVHSLNEDSTYKVDKSECSACEG